MVAIHIGNGARLEPNRQGIFIEGFWTAECDPVGGFVVELNCELVCFYHFVVVVDFYDWGELAQGDIYHPVENYIGMQFVVFCEGLDSVGERVEDASVWIFGAWFAGHIFVDEEIIRAGINALTLIEEFIGASSAVGCLIFAGCALFVTFEACDKVWDIEESAVRAYFIANILKLVLMSVIALLGAG